MHRHAAARLNLTSAIELSDLNTAGQAWVHGRAGIGYGQTVWLHEDPTCEVFNNYRDVVFSTKCSYCSECNI